MAVQDVEPNSLAGKLAALGNVENMGNGGSMSNYRDFEDCMMRRRNTSFSLYKPVGRCCSCTGVLGFFRFTLEKDFSSFHVYSASVDTTDLALFHLRTVEV